MAGRCGCASDDCRCNFVAGDGISIEGTGTKGNPVTISAAPTSFGGGGPDRIPGEMVVFGGAVAPAGWLICDGSAVSRTVYSALFAAIGIAWGSGDGATTFNVPDLRDRAVVGASGTKGRGTVGGTTQLTSSHLPSHTHSINHDHPSVSTAAAGAHDHQTYHSGTDGASASTFREASTTGRVQDRSLAQSDGSHSHTVDLPALVGTSGAAGAATPSPFQGPYAAAPWIIKA